mgnify:CR=1 FL=1
MNEDEKLDNEPGETEDKVGGDQGEPTEEPTDEVAALKATVEALQETANAQQTQIYALQDANAQRIIPAYAGSTRRDLSARYRHSDHPRLRGEHSESLRTPVL